MVPSIRFRVIDSPEPDRAPALMFTTWKTDGSFDLSPRTPNEQKPAATLTSLLADTASITAAPLQAPREACSIINEFLTMRGEIESEGDLLVKGRVQGTLRCRLLIIDAGAVVEGSISAEDVVIRGQARGTIKTKKIRLEKTAIVDCEIFHDSFSAEEGARVKGTLHSNEDAGTADAASPAETPEAKVSSALYQMLDVARAPNRPRPHSVTHPAASPNAA